MRKAGPRTVAPTSSTRTNRSNVRWSRLQRRAAFAARFLLLWSAWGKAMVIRTSSTPDFRRAQIRWGRRWLPLFAFLLLPFDAFAYDALNDVHEEIDARFAGLREEQRDLAESYRRLHAKNQQFQNGFLGVAGQAQKLSEENGVTGTKEGPAETTPPHP